MHLHDELAGRIVLITGGTSGLGFAVAVAAGKAGATLLITGRDSARGKVAVQTLRNTGADGHFVAADASNPGHWEGLVLNALHRLGKLHGLVNNVGWNSVKPIRDTTSEDYRRMIAINLYSTFLGTKFALSIDQQTPVESIVNISSMAALYSHPEVAPYCVAKAAVGELSRTLVAERKQRLPRINTVFPGIFLTELTSETAFPNRAARDTQLARIPAQRFGHPMEIGHLVRFLLSGRSRGISGADFVVDGGRTA